MGFKLIWLYPYKKGKCWHGNTHTEHLMKTGIVLPQVKEMSEARREPWNKSFSRTFRKSMASCTPWSQTSSLQNCEIIDFLLFKPPSLSYFARATLAKNNASYMQPRTLPQTPSTGQWWLNQLSLRVTGLSELVDPQWQEHWMKRCWWLSIHRTGP